MRNFHSTFSREPYPITPLLTPETADPNDAHATAEVLMDTEAYQVYLHMDQFSYQEVFLMALEEASKLVAERQAHHKQLGAIAASPHAAASEGISILFWS